MRLDNRTKARAHAFSQTKVALNLYDFVIRKPGHPTQKFIMRAYDEPILAAMVLNFFLVDVSSRLTCHVRSASLNPA